MKVVYTDTVRRHIASQIGYLVDQGAVAPARRLRSRIASFVRNFIAHHPRASRHIPELDVYETWIRTHSVSTAGEAVFRPPD